MRWVLVGQVCGSRDPVACNHHTMEMQGVVVSRLSESTVAGASLTRDLPFHKCAGFLEGGVGYCSCKPVSASALGKCGGGFRAISSGELLRTVGITDQRGTLASVNGFGFKRI